MRKHNAKNERVKHTYSRYLAEADGKSRATIDTVQKAILRLEVYTGFKDFGTFNREQAIAFKKHLAKVTAEKSGKPLSLSTVNSTLVSLRNFLKWLAQQNGYKSKIHMLDIAYLNLSDKEVRAATAPAARDFPTLEQVRRVVMTMPSNTAIAKRDQALVAFTMLTGIRAEALISLKIKHINLEQAMVYQDPREVKTKNSKRIYTTILPICDILGDVVTKWLDYLQNTLLYGFDKPLFPSTHVAQDKNQTFAAIGLSSEHWSSTNAVRRIFREAFEAAGLPYYHPHSLRHTLSHLMQRQCKSIEEVVAWSRSLGHESPTTTFECYGHMSPQRQGEVLRRLKKK